MKKVIIWVAALIITLSAAIYQRATGPTYPLKLDAELAGKDFDFKLTRSASIGEGCTVEIPKSDLFDKAEIVYRKYPGNFDFDTLKMQLSAESWQVQLPVQPAAAKLEYYAVLKNEDDKVLYQNMQNTAVVRFKGDVPKYILVPHVIAMFLAMLFSTAAALMAIFKIGNFRRIAFITLGLLVLGGLILGPIVQYYAFGDAWTGWPVGQDLTDNKLLITVLAWIGAVLLNFKKPRKWAVIVAAIVLLAVYSIPHSARGSEYNYDTGEVQTG
ncbi:hypothetical protein [Salinivirga cyanobacteriivorans]